MVETITVIFENNEDIIRGLLTELEKNSVRKCRFLEGNGAIKGFQLDVFQGGLLNSKEHKEEFKLVNIIGNAVYLEGNGYKADIVAKLQGADGKTVNGMLSKGKASGELVLKGEILERM